MPDTTPFSPPSQNVPLLTPEATRTRTSSPQPQQGASVRFHWKRYYGDPLPKRMKRRAA